MTNDDDKKLAGKLPGNSLLVTPLTNVRIEIHYGTKNLRKPEDFIKSNKHQVIEHFEFRFVL